MLGRPVLGEAALSIINSTSVRGLHHPSTSQDTLMSSSTSETSPPCAFQRTSLVSTSSSPRLTPAHASQLNAYTLLALRHMRRQGQALDDWPSSHGYSATLPGERCCYALCCLCARSERIEAISRAGATGTGTSICGLEERGERGKSAACK